MSMEEYAKVAIGSVLGDGSLSPTTKRFGNSSIDISQHESKLPYLLWLYEKLGKGYALNKIYKKKGYNLYRFCSKPNNKLGKLREIFYSSDGKKIIPSNLKELFKDPITLAVWYMDDGTLDKRHKYHFNSMIASYCFSFEECEHICKVLFANFSIKASVTKCMMRGKYYPRIYIRSESMERFINTIKPFVHPVFKYKIGESIL